MSFSKAFIRRVTDQIDLVRLISEHGVVLKKTGSSFKGLCPFHSEKTPSFSVSPLRGFFHCFGCGASGDAIKFLMLHENISFPDATEELAKRCGVPLEFESGKPGKKTQADDKGMLCLHDAEDYYHWNLRKGKGEEGREYLNERMVPESLWQTFQIGFAARDWRDLKGHLQKKGYDAKEMLNTGLIKEHEQSGRHYDRFRGRLVFPVRDLRGRCVGFGGRVVKDTDQPKYLNSPETAYYRKNQVLYGLYEGLEGIRKTRELICVEGYLDVLRMHEHGFSRAVAPCGTALTVHHLKLIQRYADSVVLLFDGDRAGREAALKHCSLFLPYPLDASIVLLPEGEDPDSFLLNNGTDAFQQLLLERIPVLHYLVEQTLAGFPGNLPGRMKALESLMPHLSSISDIALRQLTLNSLAERMRLPLEMVLKKSNKILKKTTENDKNTSMPPVFHEHGDERWILQALINHREWAPVIREHLNPEELHNKFYRDLYEKLLKFPADTFQPFKPQFLENETPELYKAVIALTMEEVPRHEVLLSLKRIKERHLEGRFLEQRTNGTVEERARAGIQHRREVTALQDVFEKLAEPQNSSETP